MQDSEGNVPPVLVFDRVIVAAETSAATEPLDLEVARGEVVRLRLGPDGDSLPLVELALGLQEPRSGVVRFDGVDWGARNAFDQAAARGRCGAVFAEPSWISSLSVPENIVLRLEHASRLASEVIHDDAAAKARLAGLDAIDARRPDLVPARELRVLEWVRAFIGCPALVVMVCPEEGAPAPLWPGLAALVRRAAGEGTAILWASRQDDNGLTRDVPLSRTVDMRDSASESVSREGQA